MCLAVDGVGESLRQRGVARPVRVQVGGVQRRGGEAFGARRQLPRRADRAARVTFVRWNSCPVTCSPAAAEHGIRRAGGGSVAESEPRCHLPRRRAPRRPSVCRPATGTGRAARRTRRRSGYLRRLRTAIRLSGNGSRRARRRAPRGNRRRGRCRRCPQAGPGRASGSNSTTSHPAARSSSSVSA